jgi:hypothetical protein
MHLRLSRVSCACRAAIVLMCWPDSPTPTSGAPQRSLIDRLLYDTFEEELIIQPGRYFPPDVRLSLTAFLCARGSVLVSCLLARTSPPFPNARNLADQVLPRERDRVDPRAIRTASHESLLVLCS